MKIANSQVVFREFPDEITLALNISNCPCHCKGCHSEYLAEDIGEEVTRGLLIKLITDNKGITCVGIMGGDADPKEVMETARMIRSISEERNLKLKIGWYSGKDDIPYDCFDAHCLDYIKLGHYDENRGGLDKKGTNQSFYWVETYGNKEAGGFILHNITNKFRTKEAL